uniref:BRCA1-associated protein n=1 Tax=Tetraselmis sp. GSL018 TaxID=582737 RepID=A0A061RRD2_9CHLO
MYTIKIESSSDMSHKDNETTQSSLSAEAGVSCRPKQDSSDTVEFSVGNPRVEHITGLVHLYRKVNPQQESESNSFPGALPEERSNRLCILKLPDDLSVAEFCQFLGAHLSKVREMRFVRRETPAVYQPSMVLMRFDEQDTADTFFAEYSRKPFSSLEPDVVCTLVYVKDVEVLSGESLELSPPPGQTELPTCPVCLERLDEHISGVITTVCNHRFHNECLQRWADSSCPVCRYVQQSPNSSHCATCGSRENLWICLICGHVGCGRYMEAHAADHFRESGHCYSLELETQRVGVGLRGGRLRPPPDQVACGREACRGAVAVPRRDGPELRRVLPEQRPLHARARGSSARLQARCHRAGVQPSPRQPARQPEELL